MVTGRNTKLSQNGGEDGHRKEHKTESKGNRFVWKECGADLLSQRGELVAEPFSHSIFKD
jgi:hypothetical protein